MSPQLRFNRLMIPDPMSGCHVWIGSRNRDGYGYFKLNRKTQYAHRAAWALSGRPLPPKPLELDHMCRTSSCVNPSHLRVVTPRENITYWREKTACPQGHAYDVVYPKPSGLQQRGCRQCKRAASRRYRARQRQRAVEGGGR